jgi:hypothetical protein
MMATGMYTQESVDKHFNLVFQQVALEVCLVYFPFCPTA